MIFKTKLLAIVFVVVGPGMAGLIVVSRKLCAMGVARQGTCAIFAGASKLASLASKSRLARSQSTT